MPSGLLTWRKVPKIPKWYATESGIHVVTISSHTDVWRIWVGELLQRAHHPDIANIQTLKEAKEFAVRALNQLREALPEGE